MIGLLHCTEGSGHRFNPPQTTPRGRGSGQGEGHTGEVLVQGVPQGVGGVGGDHQDAVALHGQLDGQGGAERRLPRQGGGGGAVAKQPWSSSVPERSTPGHVWSHPGTPGHA